MHWRTLGRHKHTQMVAVVLGPCTSHPDNQAEPQFTLHDFSPPNLPNLPSQLTKLTLACYEKNLRVILQKDTPVRARGQSDKKWTSPKHSMIPLLALDRSKLLACKIEWRTYIRIVYIRVLNIRCIKYFVFYFRSRTSRWKYFNYENFPIYGTYIYNIIYNFIYISHT